ncbi:MAG: hypothetical protein IKF90_21205 [Parasporobacterium sp.]|nr:hypothetical protein [Parasporobacterium sp.]
MMKDSFRKMFSLTEDVAAHEEIKDRLLLSCRSFEFRKRRSLQKNNGKKCGLK